MTAESERRAPPGTIVVAVGGNALAPIGQPATIHDQFRFSRESLSAVVALAAEQWRIAIVHGNGPQVGEALERNEMAHERIEPLPLGVLVASTAGWIGYMIQQSLQNALAERQIGRDVITLVTQTVVDAADPRLANPTKPIGHSLTEAVARRLQSQGIPVATDKRGRVRRLAPSPDPHDIVEADAVYQLVNEGKIVIAAGGGGTPVVTSATGFEGVDAVVDKDRAAAVLGHRLGADVLLILTDVDGVYRHWGTPQQDLVKRLTVSDAEDLLSGDELGVGSMRPKVEAGATFVRLGGRRAVIAELGKGLEAIRGTTGTTIIGDTT